MVYGKKNEVTVRGIDVEPMIVSVHHFHPNTHPENSANIILSKQSIFCKENHPLLKMLDSGGNIHGWPYMDEASVLAADVQWSKAEATADQVSKDIDIPRLLDFQIFGVLSVSQRNIAKADEVWQKHLKEKFPRIPDFHVKLWICRCKGR